MAAYSAVVSFGQLLEQLLNSDQLPPNSDLQAFHENISSLQASVQTIFPAPKNERATARTLETRIRDVIYQAQDAVESFIAGKTASLTLQEVTTEMDPIAAQAAILAASIKKEREKWLDGDIPPPPRSGIISRTTRIVGQEKYKKLLTDELLKDDDKLQVLPISGMAGIGKTTLARSLYDEPKIKNSFAFRAWVTVSQDYHIGDILARLLNSMESRGQKAGERVYEGSDEQLKVHLHQSLYNNKYLVVIDDMWEEVVWDKVRNFLPDNKNGSRIILTTRLLSIAKNVNSAFHHQMGALDEESSWILLCDKAFGGMECPPHLERIGREIARNCEGLPLSLSVIGGLLAQERQTEEYWLSVEEDTNAAVMKGQDSYFEILSLSYDHLPGKLKGCFLYLGAFPEDSDIPVSKLFKLWVAEGFLVLSQPDSRMEKVAEEHLTDLVQRNLITVRKVSSHGRIKTCGMHDIMRDLAVITAEREKFFHSVKRYANAPMFEEGAVNQRRVSVHRNILMCLEEVYQSTKLIKDARSLLYVGPHHHHQLPFCLTFDLLRVLDAFTVYFIEFPDEVLQLIHLRYLSLTYNDDLPPQISQLRNLQVLMVRRHPKIIFIGVSFLPDEIWDMPQLRHIWLTETDFPAVPPITIGVPFSNLQSLSNINADSCTREVLRSMPNLKKLGMWVEAPGVVGLYLDELQQLEAFKFTVLNFSPKEQVEFQPKIFLPPTLRKLSLSGCGLPWEDMGVIAALPDLEVLKLRELAFNDEEWRTEYEFKNLKFLLIEYLNFKKWEAKQSQFLSLERLILRHCYELEDIPRDLGYIADLELIELVDCSPGAMAAAEDIQRDQEQFDHKGLQLTIYCSYE